MHTKKLITHYKTHTHTHTTKLPFLQLLLKSSHTTMMMINSSSSIFMSPNQEQLHPYTSLSIFISEIQMLELLLAGVVFLSLHSLRGGSSFPLVGMLPSLLLGLKTGNIYDWLTEVLASARLRTGRSTFAFRGPPFTNLHCVVTSDPANLEHLLRARFPNFPKGPYFRDTARDLLGRGIFNADGDAWRAQRRAASLHFHSARFRSMTAESLVELVHGRLLPVLESGEVDLQEVLLRLTFDNVCAIAFGVDPGCLRAGLPEVAFARAFEAATEGTFARFLRPTAAWKAMRWAGAGGEGRLREAIEGVDEFARGVIEERRRRKKGGDREGADLLTVMMMKGGDEEMYYSERMMRDVCVNLILAGRDTSSVALSWFFWLLDGNREAEERILDEIRGILRDREEEQEEEEEELVFRAEEVKKMDYLHAALSEALRLYPSVPVDHKEVLEDDEFPDGTILKKGTKVVYAIYAMGRMESIWGKDCRDFKPERWLRDGRFVSESAYKFAAFNAGPRLCLGKDFAYYQMKFVAASILYRYRVEVVRDHPVVPKMALTMYMKYGLKVELKKRQLNLC